MPKLNSNPRAICIAVNIDFVSRWELNNFPLGSEQKITDKFIHPFLISICITLIDQVDNRSFKDGFLGLDVPDVDLALSGDH